MRDHQNQSLSLKYQAYKATNEKRFSTYKIAEAHRFLGNAEITFQ